MSIHTTKNGKPIIYRDTKLPMYSNTVEARIKQVKQQLNQGLSKNEAIWNSICTTFKIQTL